MRLATHVLRDLDVAAAFHQVQDEVDEGHGLLDTVREFVVLPHVLVDQERSDLIDHVLIIVDICLCVLLESEGSQNDVRKRRSEDSTDLDEIVLFENV